MDIIFSGKGVIKVEIDLKSQRVVVEADNSLINGEQILETISKTEKAASYLGVKQL